MQIKNICLTLNLIINLFGYEKYNNCKCAIVEFSNYSKEDDISYTNKIWIDLKTGIMLKSYNISINQNIIFKTINYSEFILNQVKNEDVVKPNISEFTHYNNEK